MSSNTPIFTIAKDLNVESNRIILACKKLGIDAKGSTKRLNKEELEKIKSYFETGKNVSDEVINLNKVKTKSKNYEVHIGTNLISKLRNILKKNKILFSIFVFETSVISFTLSGSFGQATIGCVTFAKSISMISSY